ncbi:hypothetical protein CE91St28_11420 [Pyramidobacter piscolens]|nr:hypothetical protein CE91St28_11420 [Pyramidobacter piscolens]
MGVEGVRRSCSRSYKYDCDIESKVASLGTLNLFDLRKSRMMAPKDVVLILNTASVIILRYKR